MVVFRVHDTDTLELWKGLPDRTIQRQLLDLQAGMRRPAGWWLTEAQSDDNPPSDDEDPFAVPLEVSEADGEQEGEDELLPQCSDGAAEVVEGPEVTPVRKLRSRGCTCVPMKARILFLCFLLCGRSQWSLDSYIIIISASICRCVAHV